MRRLLLYISIFYLIGCGDAPDTFTSQTTINAEIGPTPEINQPIPDDGTLNKNTYCYKLQNFQSHCHPIDPTPDDYGYLSPLEEPNNLTNPQQYLPPQNLISLNQIEIKSQISPHFRWAEVFKLSSHSHGYFSNKVLSALEVIRTALAQPLIINSGYRSPAYNQQLKGAAKWSRHIYGDAVDISTKDLSVEKIKAMCLKLGANYFQIYTQHIHCDWRESPLEQLIYGVNFQLPLTNHSTPLARPSRHKIRITKHKNSVELSISTDSKEDSGQLLIEWEVTPMSPNSKTHIAQSSTYILTTDSHPIFVKAKVGGSSEVSQIIYP